MPDSFSFELWEKIISSFNFLSRRRLICTCKMFSEIISRWENVDIQVASFDIGKTNFAQYVEHFRLDDLLILREKYKDLPLKNQRRTAGVVSDEMRNIINDVCQKAKRVNIGVFDFSEGIGNKLTNEIRLSFLKHMDEYYELWKTCDIFLIEQQFVNLFGAKRGINLDAVKMAEALTMWFLDRFKDKSVQLFGSQYKTKILGAPTKMKKPQRKKWACVYAEEIFTKRKDQELLDCFDLSRKVKGKRINTEVRVSGFLEPFQDLPSDIKILAEKIIRKKQKLDDISDVVLQLQAYKIKYFVALF